MAGMATVAALGAFALVAMMMTSSPVELEAKGLGLKTSDLALLQHAIHAQNAEKHKACITECTTDACKKACGKVHTNSALKKAMASTFKKVNIHHKKKLGLKTKDEQLLKDAIKGQQKDEVEHCKQCLTKECKLNCKKILAAHTKKAHIAKPHLGLKKSDMSLLQDAKKRQAKETAKGMYMHKMDQEALKHKSSSSLKVDLLNHQQLKDEEEQAAQTAKIAAANDADDSWSH